jgi:hypothetical protein
MPKITKAVSAQYDGKTNTVTATGETADGETIGIEIDGIAWAQLIGQATIEHLVFKQIQLGQSAPWLTAIGVQTGHVSNSKTGEHSFGLSLLVPNGGVMHFLLPPSVEKALREKLTPPQQPH